METEKIIRLKTKNTYTLLFISLLIALPASIVIGVIFGSSDVSLTDIFVICRDKIIGVEVKGIPASSVSIVWGLRFPRMILAIVVGGGLAICGAAMQAITQNVLAEPYILGVSSGASAMVAFAYYLSLDRIFSGSAVAVFAFLGALLSLLLVYAIGAVGQAGTRNYLILGGMAVSVILNAVTNFFSAVLPNDSALKNVILWMWGSLAGARWDNVALPAAVSIIGLIFFCCMSSSYNLISLGRETAISLGINIKKVTGWTLFAVSVLTGIFVASCGLIGFVGFIIPHIVRMLIGSEHRKLFPFTYLSGAVFLAWIDIISRNILAPREMAVGIFSAFVGGPFFVFLLIQKKRNII